MRYFLILVTLGLASCQGDAGLASAKGPVFPLNVGRWKPAQTDLQPRPEGGIHGQP
ncbi:type IV secretion system lipoprotein VirB7 (plasmid) [Agrobacterium leguminum]|uniref:type IV secretion system lipoprotein VirB7 n=1 Tax=Agrobacterium TaxID=357 RepID=UPI0009BC502C|nr:MULTISPECIES: type IV secretion system lipoprotein VirB7 [Agrobacterium]WFS69653.1 type IV secretion system lipoprotein VirB7 [Agrobacterium leguminum]